MSSTYGCRSPTSANTLHATISTGWVVMPKMAGIESNTNITSATAIAATSSTMGGRPGGRPRRPR